MFLRAFRKIVAKVIALVGMKVSYSLKQATIITAAKG